MTTEDKSHMPLFSPEDENEAKKVPDHHSTNGTLKVNHKWTGFQGKTFWDWLQFLGVLAIPLILGIATIGFGIQQANLAQKQHDSDQQRALDQQQATILQTYIDNIQDLLLNHKLLTSQPSDDVAILARARTMTALQGLDSSRKGLLVQFIYEARLIGFLDDNRDKIRYPIIGLHDADLSGADLRYADLSGVNLIKADLSGADLHYVNLSKANLIVADLSGADLSKAALIEAALVEADLKGANLSGAHLDNADLSGANLRGAHNLTQKQLDQVKLCDGAILPQGLTCHHNQ